MEEKSAMANAGGEEDKKGKNAEVSSQGRGNDFIINPGISVLAESL
jgi:hypothetical protein